MSIYHNHGKMIDFLIIIGIENILRHSGQDSVKEAFINIAGHPMNPSSIIRVGVVQFDVRLGDIESNVKSMQEGIGRLAAQGARLAVLPELCSCGFDVSRIGEHAAKTPALLTALSALARKHRLLIAGSFPEICDEHVYNTKYLLDETGEIAGKYRKIHLFPLLCENDYFQAGDRPVICRTSIGVIGLMICYDIRFPELCRSLSLSGAQMALVSAQWPQARADHWDILLRARAIENQIFIIASNRCGKDADLIFAGRSQIIAPSGEAIASLGDGPAEIAADMDLAEISASKSRFDCLKDRVPSAYK